MDAPSDRGVLPRLLTEVMDTLFPVTKALGIPPYSGCPSDWRVNLLEVSAVEMTRAVNRLRDRLRAPGPDGVQEGRLKRFFSLCLSQGRFLRVWKIAYLVLLRKQGRFVGEPSTDLLTGRHRKATRTRSGGASRPALVPGEPGFITGAIRFPFRAVPPTMLFVRCDL